MRLGSLCYRRSISRARIYFPPTNTRPTHADPPLLGGADGEEKGGWEGDLLGAVLSGHLSMPCAIPLLPHPHSTR